MVGGYCEGSSRRGYPGLLYVHVFSAVAVLARSLNFETPVVELGPKRKIKVKKNPPWPLLGGDRSEHANDVEKAARWVMKYFGNGASSKCYQSCRKEPRGKSGEDVRGQTVSVAKWFFGRGNTPTRQPF